MNPNDHFGSGNMNENPHDDFPAREAVFRTEDEVQELRRRLEHFALAQQALYELFAAKLGVTDDEVMAKMAEIDARDGTVDHRLGSMALVCPACKRRTPANMDHCIYCSAPVKGGHLFQKL